MEGFFYVPNVRSLISHFKPLVRHFKRQRVPDIKNAQTLFKTLLKQLRKKMKIFETLPYQGPLLPLTLSH